MVIIPLNAVQGKLRTGSFSYPKAISCPLTLSLSKGVSGPLNVNGTPLIWFDKLTMSGVDPEVGEAFLDAHPGLYLY